MHPAMNSQLKSRRNETIAEVSNEGGDSETPASQSVRYSQLTNA